MKKIMDCFNEAAKIRFFLLQIAFFENFRFQQTVFSCWCRWLPQRIFLKPQITRMTRISFSRRCRWFTQRFFETADCADDAVLFLPQMPMIYAEDFFEPQIARIARISFSRRCRWFTQRFFETADCADDADFFLPQMPLIYAEDFSEPQIARIALIVNKLQIYRLHRWILNAPFGKPLRCFDRLSNLSSGSKAWICTDFHCPKNERGALLRLFLFSIA